MTRSSHTGCRTTACRFSRATRLSVAFAIWDGTAQDRDGKKLITIWQDFELED